MFVLDLYMYLPLIQSMLSVICLNLIMVRCIRYSVKFHRLEESCPTSVWDGCPSQIEHSYHLGVSITFLGISFASYLCRIPCFLDPIFFFFFFLVYFLLPRKRVHRWYMYFWDFTLFGNVFNLLFYLIGNLDRNGILHWKSLSFINLKHCCIETSSSFLKNPNCFKFLVLLDMTFLSSLSGSF